MALSRTNGRILTLSLLSVFLALVAYDERLSPSQPPTGKIFYNCYSCDSAKSCSLVVAHSETETGLPCESLNLSNSCAAACNCPSGTWPCEDNACMKTFSNGSNWISYQPNVSRGYVGSVYDRARYLYFVPYKNDAGPQGVVWKYDTLAVINSVPSWTNFDPSSNGLGTAARGFAGGAFDGRYVYFAPNESVNGPSGNVMRYDTTKAMDSIASWETFDPSNNGLSEFARGYNGAVFDGKYVYFVPDFNTIGAHNDVLRYEVSKPFKDASSWQVFNPKSSSSAKKGYAGALYDGRYVYFIPKGSNRSSSLNVMDDSVMAGDLLAQEKGKPAASSAFHGEVMRYDTRASFTSAAAWTTYEPAANGVGANARGYHGGVFDGTYLYFAPYINNGGPHGEVLRYNTKQSFTSAASWTAFNVSTGGVHADAKGYIGAAFDGQFVYFSPYYDGKAYHGKVLRFNTKGSFVNKIDWTVLDAATVQSSSAASSVRTGGSGRNYQLFSSADPISWQDAEASCVSKGGHLATITSAADNDAAYAKLNGKANVWIGLNDIATEGAYKWASGEPFGASFWVIGQPNGESLPLNDCVFMNHDSPSAGPLWHDVECDGTTAATKKDYLCELPSSSSSACAVVSECIGGRVWDPVSCSCKNPSDVSSRSSVAASSAPTVPTGGGGAGTLGLTGPNGETPVNNVLTVPKGSRVQFSWNCPGSVSVDSYSGFQGTAITCQLKAGGMSIVSNALQSGGTSVSVSAPGSYTFKCSWLLYNSISSYEQVVCDKSTTINVSN